MGKIKVNIEELQAAISELKARSKKNYVEVSVVDRDVHISTVDNNDNFMEVVLNNEQKVAAQFRYTERLMFMKDRKGKL